MSLRRSKRNVNRAEDEAHQAKEIKIDKEPCTSPPRIRTRSSTNKASLDARQSEGNNSHGKIRIDYLNDDFYSIRKPADKLVKNNNSRAFKDLELEANLNVNVKETKFENKSKKKAKIDSKAVKDIKNHQFSGSDSIENDSEDEFETKRIKKSGSKSKKKAKINPKAVKDINSHQFSESDSIENDSEDEFETKRIKKPDRKSKKKAKINSKVESAVSDFNNYRFSSSDSESEDEFEIKRNKKSDSKSKKKAKINSKVESAVSDFNNYRFSSSDSESEDEFEIKRNKKCTSKNKLSIEKEFLGVNAKLKGKINKSSANNDSSSSESDCENVFPETKKKKIVPKAKIKPLKSEEDTKIVNFKKDGQFLDINSDDKVGENGNNESDCDWGDVLNEIKKEKTKSNTVDARNKYKDHASSSDDDWEEVKGMGNEEVDSEDEKQECADKLEPVIPAEGVVITIEGQKKNKKKKLDFQAEIIRRINRFQVELQLSMHKVHLLCYLAYGLKMNSLINSDEMQAFALSILPPSHFKFKKNLSSFQQILRWYKENFSLKINAKRNYDRLSDWKKGFATKQLPSEVDFVCCFLVFLRPLKVKSRLIISFRPVPRKLPSEKLLSVESIKNTAQQLTAEVNNEVKIEDKPGTSTESHQNSKTTNEKEKKLPKSKNVQVKSKDSKKKGKSGLKNKKRKQSIEDEVCKKKKRCSRRVTKKVKYAENEDKSNSEEDDDVKIEMDIDYVHSSSNGESDAEEIFVVKKEKAQIKRRKSLKREEENILDDVEVWAEVFIEREQRWISVNCFREEFDLPHQFEKSATRPFDYVMAFDESNYVFDVTRRYAEQCLHPEHRKRRVDPKWWNSTLKPFSNPHSKTLTKEMILLDNKLLEKPLPNTFTEYKNHPYYVLQRHLLKFEGIYPPDAVPVGYFRKEPVYSRDSVHELHSRETWFKEARLVKLNETPYKLVKARPKWIRRTREVKYPDKPLEIFGHWQTEDYVPPVAKGGKVPRNEHGNVDLLKPCMLPIGTVHLKLPGLNRVAKKLNIDCGAAFVGWEFTGGSNHPSFDGWVVCTEFKDVLVEAWHEEQMIAQEREQTKKDKRVYGNWKRFIKGVLIAERLKAKYLTKN